MKRVITEYYTSVLNVLATTVHIESGGVVTAVESPSLFYFQRSADTRRLEKLFVHINKVSVTAPAVSSPNVGK